MEIGDKIALQNRDFRTPDYIELIEIKDNECIFKCIPYPPYSDFWGITAGDNPDTQWVKPFAIDPPGGPFMSIDHYKLNKDLLLTEIEMREGEGYYLTFKKL